MNFLPAHVTFKRDILTSSNELAETPCQQSSLSLANNRAVSGSNTATPQGNWRITGMGFKTIAFQEKSLILKKQQKTPK